MWRTPLSTLIAEFNTLSVLIYYFKNELNDAQGPPDFIGVFLIHMSFHVIIKIIKANLRVKEAGTLLRKVYIVLHGLEEIPCRISGIKLGLISIAV